MGVGNFLEQLASAFMQRKRDELGITDREAKTKAAQSGQLLRQAQIQRLIQQLELAPAEQESEIALRTAQTSSADAQAKAALALAGQREVPKPQKMVERTVDLGDRVEYIYTDGSREVARKGATPRAVGEGGGSGDGSVAANPFLMLDVTTGKYRSAVRVKGGGFKWVDEIEGTPVEPGPTAEMRNTEAQSQAVEPAFDLVQKSLDSLKQASAGLVGSIAGVIPGTQSNFAKTRFQDQAKALLGAIVARQSGEGSRLSDEDRRAYSQAATLVNNLILLPGGIEEAQGRLDDVKALLDQVIQRRHRSTVVSPMNSDGNFRVVGKRPKP